MIEAGPVKKTRVLVVDDHKDVLKACTEILSRADYEVVAVSESNDAFTICEDPTIDVACLDLKMPNFSGMDLLRAFRTKRPDMVVIIITAFGSEQSEAEAMAAGAFEYLRKPFSPISDLAVAVKRAADHRALLQRAQKLQAELDTKEKFEELIGRSAQMREVFKLVDTVSRISSNVLIQGESGTGKELVARAIHFRSPRKDGPFVAVNCSALTDSLLESELFGHVKGSFTGAVGNKKGLFEAANRGTIFLDEIGDVSQATQVRLLRVLQESEVKPVGANVATRVDVRVVAATNVDLAQAKERGAFRKDLYYRLNVLTVSLPALRDRAEDIPVLANYFLDTYANKFGKKVGSISAQAMRALEGAGWPGNVRELENVIERGVVLARGTTLELADLPPQLAPKADRSVEPKGYYLATLPYAEAKKLALRAFERTYLKTLLDKEQGNITRAARAARIDRSNFRRLLKQYDVVKYVDGEEDALLV